MMFIFISWCFNKLTKTIKDLREMLRRGSCCPLAGSRDDRVVTINLGSEPERVKEGGGSEVPVKDVTYKYLLTPDVCKACSAHANLHLPKHVSHALLEVTNI